MARSYLAVLIILLLAIKADAQSDGWQTSLSTLREKAFNDPSDSNKLSILMILYSKYYWASSDNKMYRDSMLHFLEQARVLNHSVHSEKWQIIIDCHYNKYYLLTGVTTRANEYRKKIETTISRKPEIADQIYYWGQLASTIYNLDTIGITRIGCFEEIISCFKKEKNWEGELEYQRNIADEHMKQGKLDLAEKELLTVLERYRKIGYSKLHYTYNLLSITNSYKGNFNIALQYELMAIENMLQTSDTGNAGRYYSNIAYLYHDLGDWEKSINYFKLSLIRKRSNPVRFYDFRDAGVLTGDMIKANRTKEALRFIKKFSNENPPADTLSKASLYQTMAYCYYSLNNDLQSSKYYNALIKIAPYLNANNEIRQEVEFDIAAYYLRKKQFRDAAIHLEISMQEAMTEKAAKKIRDINLLYFKIDSAEGKYISAIDHLNAYRYLNDSIFNETKSKQIQEVQAKYETEKKEQNILMLQKENLVQQNSLKQAVITRNYVIASIFLLLFIMVLLFNRYQIKRSANLQLTASQHEIERQNSTLKHLVNEKEWLLKEIHHRVKNNLHTIIGLLNAQTSFLKNEEAIVAISDSQHRVQAMSLIHQKLFQSDNLSTVEMSPYIHELVDYLEHSLQTPQHIKFRIEVDQCIFKLSHALPIGLILNEAITNSIKYAFKNGEGNGLITVSLKKYLPDRYKLTIADNGIGLPPDFDAKRNFSMGMNLIKGLSEDLQGELSLLSNTGTKLEVVFDYEQIDRV